MNNKGNFLPETTCANKWRLVLLLPLVLITTACSSLDLDKVQDTESASTTSILVAQSAVTQTGVDATDASTPIEKPQADYWAALGDPELVELIEAALKVSPSLASARGRIERSRAERVAADATWMPLVLGSANVSRGRTEPQLPISMLANAGIQANWELDIFGAGRASSAAEEARLAGAEEAFNAVRLSVAAETGQSYVALRACEAQHILAEQESKSHEITVKVSEAAVEAGYFPSDQAALARAAASLSGTVLSARTAQCARLLQSLVMMTDKDEGELRQRLALRSGVVPVPMGTLPEAMPANLLMRRPDLREAAHLVLASLHDERAMRARQWPTLSLQGAIGKSRLTTPQATFNGQVWSFGPLQLTLPIFDSGVRKAHVHAAEASRTEAQSLYLAKVRQAAEEVEGALASLHSIQSREHSARQAALGFSLALSSAEQRLKGGLSSVLDVEQARRLATQARSTVIDLRQARANAWITLYRVMGGGW